MSNNQIALFLMASIGTIIVVNHLVSNIYGHLKDFNRIRKMNSKFKELMRKKEEMEENGDYHEWVSINIGDRIIMVCKKTGWIPSNRTFLSLDYVDKLIKREEKLNEILTDCAERVGIKVEEAKQFMEEYSEEILSYTREELG